jgi:GTP cyclohydrolase I
LDRKRIEKAVREIIEAIGENPEREGLRDTPKRVAEMYAEIFSGYEDNGNGVKCFDEQYGGEMIAIRDIPLYSMCEHHLASFFGTASIVYCPTDGKIPGLSKLARIVEVASKKLQLQERLTGEIAEKIMKDFEPKGVLVYIEAEHLCMSMRGVRKSAKTVTSAVRGTIDKREALELIRRENRE